MYRFQENSQLYSNILFINNILKIRYISVSYQHGKFLILPFKYSYDSV